MNSVKELMSIHGYKFARTCWCDGYKTMVYLKDKFEFKWRLHKYQFRVKERGVLKKNWSPVKEAEDYLNSIHAPKDQKVPEA